MKKHTLLLACAMRILLNLIALPAWGRWRAEQAGSGSSGMKKAKEAYFLERKCSNFLGSPKFFGGG